LVSGISLVADVLVELVLEAAGRVAGETQAGGWTAAALVAGNSMRHDSSTISGVVPVVEWDT
jgi:hypothetical protein